jgi:O-antigen/teichoic acid export membrane protein
MSRVSRNIVYNGLGQGLSVLLSFVAVRFVFRRLGGDALGLIYFSLALSTTLAMAVQLGICESAVREVASHYGIRPEYIKSFIRTSSLLYWAGYLTLGLVACLAAPYLVYHWVKLDSLNAVTAIKIMRILTLGALVALPIGLYRALLLGLQHMGFTNLIDVSAKALQQGGIFLILLAHGSLFNVAYWIVGSMAVQVVVYGLVCAHFFTGRALLLPGFSWEVVKQNFPFASGLIAISFCSWFLTESDKIVVSKLLPLALLGFYTFARGVVNQGGLLTGAITNAAYPHFSALHGGGETVELRKVYNKIQDLICFATVPAFAAVPFAALPLFSRVFNPHAAQMLLLPATFLCLGQYLSGTLTAPYIVSLAVGRPDISARMAFRSLFVVPPASVVAIYFFGLNGAGFSWVIYQLFSYSYAMPRISRECLGIAPRTWYGHVLRIIGSALPIYGIAWVLVSWLGNTSILALATAYIVATIIYGAVAFWMMGDELRESLFHSLQAVRLKLAEAL